MSETINDAKCMKKEQKSGSCATIKEREAARWSLPEIAGVVPTSWLDSLLSGPGAVIGKPPFDCKDIEFLLDGIRKRILNFEIPTPVPLPSEEERAEAFDRHCNKLDKIHPQWRRRDATSYTSVAKEFWDAAYDFLKSTPTPQTNVLSEETGLAPCLWIKTSERKPTEKDGDERGMVLIKGTSGNMTSGWDWAVDHSIYWMPFPPIDPLVQGSETKSVAASTDDTKEPIPANAGNTDSTR